ncbi:transposase [Pararhizobium sp.]|uniref:transposase n=1 Tax=Pararhizobium sp. TaxID=1977563 RepID=UPI00271C194D|nr:transposase [Pararhizobium sp.]MDO9417429.1 transposase [Pararhizobium sp.]
MPRLSRTVFADIPHHITQRGNRQESVFFYDDDRKAYLDWLKSYCEKHKVDILAYCLMTNHIHLIAVPATEEGLQRVLKPLHMRYAQRINRRQGWKGHLWQGRFFFIGAGRRILMGGYPLCRTQSGAGKNGCQGGRLSLVERCSALRVKQRSDFEPKT